MPGTVDFARLMNALRAFGVEPPKAVTAVLDTLAALNTPVKSKNPGEVLREIIKQAADKGRPLSVDEAQKLMGDLSHSPIAGYVQTEVRNLELPTVLLITKLLRGDAGDELMENLSPVVDHAIKGIQRAGEFYTADTTPATLIDLGSEAVEAWRAAGEHAAVLDQVLNTVLRPMTLLELIDPVLRRDWGTYLIAVWIIDPDRAYLLPQVGSVVSQSTAAFSVPGGRWLKISQMAGLHLNSPRSANDILRGLQDVMDQDNEDRYQLKEQLQRYHGIADADDGYEEVSEVDEVKRPTRQSVY